MYLGCNIEILLAYVFLSETSDVIAITNDVIREVTLASVKIYT